LGIATRRWKRRAKVSRRKRGENQNRFFKSVLTSAQQSTIRNPHSAIESLLLPISAQAARHNHADEGNWPEPETKARSGCRVSH